MSRIATTQFESDDAEGCLTQRCGVLGNLVKSLVATIRLPAVWIPLFVLAGSTLFFRLTDADMAWVRPFYVFGDPENQFPLVDVYPWKALYDWGILPGWILGCGGLAVWLASFRWPRLEYWRDEGLFYCLLLVIGPGVLVNGVMKPGWGRPRPNAIIAFGGQREFLPVWQCGIGQDEASFPSGHASMGFYLMAPAFVYYRRRPRLARGFMLLGIAGGLVVGLARVVGGGHFPSDVVWAGGFVYFAGLALAWPFRFGESIPPFWKRNSLV
jgi:lipid A 4'-phosphatase